MFFSFSCLCPHLILDDHYCCCCYCLSEVRLCWHLHHHHHHHPIAEFVGASVDVHLSTRANKHQYILTHPCYLSSHNTSIQKSDRPSVCPSKYVPKKRNKKLFVRANTTRSSQPTRGVFHGLCLWHCMCWRSVCAAGGGERELSSTHIHLVNDLYGCRLHVCSTFGWYYICMDGWTDGRTHNAYLDRPRNWRTGCTYIFMYFYLWLFYNIIS